MEKEKNNAKSPENFRTINMLYEKILERVASIFCKMEYCVNSFRKNHSTETSLAWILNEWKKEMDDGNKIL